MMTNEDYERLRKLFGMLSSDSDGEVLNAVSAISRILNVYGITWSELLLPRKLVNVRVSSKDDLPLEDSEQRPPGLAEASAQQMYAALMSSPNVDIETKRDIRDYRDAIENNRVSEKIRADLQAMYNYAILLGRRI